MTHATTQINLEDIILNKVHIKRQILNDSICMRHLRVVKFIDIVGRMWLPKAGVRSCLTDRVLVWDNKKHVELDSSNGCTTMHVLNAIDMYSFTLFIFSAGD
jgi:hypothetical protein